MNWPTSGWFSEYHMSTLGHIRMYSHVQFCPSTIDSNSKARVYDALFIGHTITCCILNSKAELASSRGLHIECFAVASQSFGVTIADGQS